MKKEGGRRGRGSFLFALIVVTARIDGLRRIFICRLRGGKERMTQMIGDGQCSKVYFLYCCGCSCWYLVGGMKVGRDGLHLHHQLPMTFSQKPPFHRQCARSSTVETIILNNPFTCKGIQWRSILTNTFRFPFPSCLAGRTHMWYYPGFWRTVATDTICHTKPAQNRGRNCVFWRMYDRLFVSYRLWSGQESSQVGS